MSLIRKLRGSAPGSARLRPPPSLLRLEEEGVLVGRELEEELILQRLAGPCASITVRAGGRPAEVHSVFVLHMPIRWGSGLPGASLAAGPPCGCFRHPDGIPCPRG